MKELPELGFTLVTLAKPAQGATAEPERSKLSRFSGGGVSNPVAAMGRPELLRHLGDLAEAIHAHCTTCRVCRVEGFMPDTRSSLCTVGATLRRAYREARRGLEAPSSELHPATGGADSKSLLLSNIRSTWRLRTKAAIT